MKKIILFLAAINILTGCASTKESVLTGAAIGGSAGLVIGNQHKNKKKARLIGAAVGSSLGGLMGYLSSKEKQKASKSKKKNSSNSLLITPLLTKPKVRMYVEPDKIQGNKYIESHRVWVIESSPSWTR